jgi:hypothetical protein
MMNMLPFPVVPTKAGTHILKSVGGTRSMGHGPRADALAGDDKE